MDDVGIFRRRRLPHWDLPGATYFITSCLHGSIPTQGLLDLEHRREGLSLRPRPEGMTDEEWSCHRWKLLFATAEKWLDLQPAVRHLADPGLATEIVDAIYHFAGQRYSLLAYVVMPSHFHWVFEPRTDWVEQLGPEAVAERPPRERIMHTLKTHTGLECNRLLECHGPFWQDESYDHCVRDTDELERIIYYVENNPVVAGLVKTPEEWLFSSARDRHLLGLPFGVPLIRPRC